MKSALITGANKGIGFEVARILAKEGFHVFLGARNLESGKSAAGELIAEGLDSVMAVQLDVTDQNSIDTAKAAITKKTGVLDVLVNNAGISGGPPNSALEVTTDQFKEVFATNVFGVAAVTQAFIGLLKNSAQPRIVNVTSAMGSLTMATDPANPKMAVY